MACRHQWCPTMANIIGMFVGFTTLQMQLAWAGTNLQCLVHFKSSIQDTSNFFSSWDTKNVSDKSNICYWQWVSRFLLDAPPVYKISVSNLRLSGTWPSGSQAVPEPSISRFERKLLHSSYPYHHQQRHIKPGLFGRVTKFTEGVNSRLLSNFERFDTLITTGLPEKSLTSITQLKPLAVFKVSNNQLSGVIPSSLKGKGKSFNASCYEGNTHLCGKPRPRNCSSTDTNQSVFLDKVSLLELELDSSQEWPSLWKCGIYSQAIS